MQWSAVESTVLVVWVLALLGLVVGVFMGVLAPGAGRSTSVERDGDGDEGRWSYLVGRVRRWFKCDAGVLAHGRAWVIVGVLLSGLMLGTMSGYRTTAARPDAAENVGAAYRQGAAGRFMDMLYVGVQEITGEGDPKAEDPLESRMARVAGLAAVLLLAFELIVKLFHEPVQRWRLKRQRGHVVICGLGRIGRELCRACCKAGLRVTVIERDPDNPAIVAAIDQGAQVCIGDATRKSVLRLVRAGRATHVFFVIGADEQNLEAAHDLLSVLLEPGSGGAGSGRELAGAKPPEMVVHLDRPTLDGVLIHMKGEERLRLFAEEVKRRSDSPERGRAERHAAIDRALEWLSGDRITLRSFNGTDRAIQELFDTHILDRRPVRAESESGARSDGPAFEVAHFVIIGFGRVGQRLAWYLAEQAHFENLRRSRMTIVHAPHEQEAVDRFREEHDKLFPTREVVQEAGDDGVPGEYDPEAPDNAWMPDARLDLWRFGVQVRDVANPTEDDRGVRFVCNGGFVAHAGGITSPGLVERLVRLSNEPTVRPMVFLCDADDEDNCSHALQLRQELDLRLKETRGECHGRDHAIAIFPFVPNRPMLTRLTTPEDTNSADLIPFGDCSAACTFENLKADPVYPVAKAILAGYSGSADAPHWGSLPEWKRYSNISAAMHLNAKLRVLGFRMVPYGAHETVDGIQLPDAGMLDRTRRITIDRMEHNRWMAERLLLGWSLGVKATPENKRRPAFVPWELLPVSERQKDEDQTAALFQVCRALAPEATDDAPPPGFRILDIGLHSDGAASESR